MSPSESSRGEPSQSAEALRQSEERFRLMIEAVKDYAIFMLDPDGYVTSWNDGAERIKGYSADEIIGKHFSIFYPQDALDREWPQYELKVARKVGRFEDEGWRIRQDGTRFWANVIITALWTDDGEMVGFTKVTRDLSERKQHEEALRASEQRLEKAYAEVTRRNKELQEFAHVASHDLKEPLRKMGSFAELLEDEYAAQLDEMGQFYLERIRDGAHRMSQLINDLLTYSRVATRTKPYEKVDLDDVVDEVVGDFFVLLEETEGHVEWSDLPSIEADPIQMRQVFQNLIANALKFHKPDVPPVVRITSQSAGDRVTISVEDNGIGFDESLSAHIFEPFQRLHTREEYEGSGLGLAICQRIIERHGGTLSAHGSPGEGARFDITLPFVQRSTPPASSAEA